jgi:biotin carboxyl carrier protein
MKEFQVRVNDRAYAITMEEKRMTVEGFNVDWEVVRVEGQHFTLAIDGVLYDVEIPEPENGRQVAIVEGIEYPVETIGLVRGRAAARKAGRPAAAAAGPVEGALTAMMPSKVIAVQVEVGDQVKAGQVVLILEAMKMESELKAAKDGTVRAVNCQRGDSVEPGVPLVVIE